MRDRQYTTPMRIVNGRAEPLHRVGFPERTFSEDWLQQLLFEYPRLLPVEAIEPVFAGLLPVARELPTERGPLDIVYVNAEGYLTLVETKLWRNPQARREVVAQIIDYAKEMSTWSYGALLARVKASRKEPTSDDPLTRIAGEASEDFDEAAFIDRVSRNLDRGLFLLLVVGDGIQEGVEEMAEFLARTPRLAFTLALVEMAVFREQQKQDEPLIVQPRIVARTREVTRAIVEVRFTPERQAVTPELQVSVTVPAEATAREAGRRRITEEEYYQELSRVASPDVVDFARWAVAEAEKSGLEVFWGDSGPTFRYRDEASDQIFSFGSFTKSRCRIYRIVHQVERAGISPSVGREYLDAVVAMIPGARRIEGDSWEAVTVGKGPKDAPFLASLVPVKGRWFAAIARTVGSIRRELDKT